MRFLTGVIEMDSNENVKKDIANEQKILIAKSINELKNIYKKAKEMFSTFNYVVQPSFMYDSSYIDAYINKHTISKTELQYLINYDYEYVNLFFIKFRKNMIVFEYYILNWSD